MTKFSWLLALFAGLALTACGDQAGTESVAADAIAGDTQNANMVAPAPSEDVMPVIEVHAAWMRPHPQGRDVTAAYFALDLASGRSDRLVSARIDGAERVEMHGHSMDPQTGMMHMEAIGPQDLLAGARMLFVPGGRHLMVFGLNPVEEGDSVAGVLVFERAGEVPVTFEVRSTLPDLPAEPE